MTAAVPSPPPAWRAAGFRYHALNFHMRRRFGGKRVQKVSINGGFTCPNADGTVAIGGCTFCDNRSVRRRRRAPRRSVTEQIQDGIARLQRRYVCDQFIAYFQPATNTYAPVERLRPLYEEALAHPQVVGLAIGTRPDCVPDDVLHLLAEIGRRTYLSVEYGMQTVHDRSLQWMNRGCTHAAFEDAMRRSRELPFEICAHVMLGLPGESVEDMLQTARVIAASGVDSVKIHNLYAVQNTPLAEQVAAGEVQLMGLADYVRVLVDFLELLPPEMVVERISGEAPPKYFVGPSWCLDKPAVKRAVDHEMLVRDSWQGKRHVPGPEAAPIA